MNYKLKEGFKHRDASGDLMEAGTVIELTDARAHALRDRFEPVDDAPVSTPAPTEDENETPGEDAVIEPKVVSLDHLSAAEAREAVDKIDDIDLLIGLLDNESRASVVKQIEHRVGDLAELAGEGE